jgi:hypothetical protein
VVVKVARSIHTAAARDHSSPGPSRPTRRVQRR